MQLLFIAIPPFSGRERLLKIKSSDNGRPRGEFGSSSDLTSKSLEDEWLSRKAVVRGSGTGARKR